MKNNDQTRDTNIKTVRKPFVYGTPVDSATVRNALQFFGILILVFFVTFIAGSSVAGAGAAVRIIFSAAVILLVLFIFFSNGSNLGADAVAKGEILYQKKEEGKPYSESERKLCYHPCKAYIIGFLGTIPFLLAAIVFAFNAKVVMTGPGTLPSWMQSYTRRADIANALAVYLHPEGLSLTDALRIAVRIFILPFVNLVGTDNPHGLLILEKISPLLLLLPSVAYGTGYLAGKKIRTRIHTMIFESNRRRKRKENRARKKRMNARSASGPEKLN